MSATFKCACPMRVAAGTVYAINMFSVDGSRRKVQDSKGQRPDVTGKLQSRYARNCSPLRSMLCIRLYCGEVVTCFDSGLSHSIIGVFLCVFYVFPICVLSRILRDKLCLISKALQSEFRNSKIEWYFAFKFLLSYNRSIYYFSSAATSTSSIIEDDHIMLL
jgi:hypothetical protein